MLKFTVILFAIIAIIYSLSGCKTVSNSPKGTPMGYYKTLVVKR
jgi:hypothetical protein